LPALIKATFRNERGLFLLSLWYGRSLARSARDFGCGSRFAHARKAPQVKPRRADVTARESVWESRSLPAFSVVARAPPPATGLQRLWHEDEAQSSDPGVASTLGGPALYRTRIDPQPLILFGTHHQPPPHRILSDVLALFFQALIRPQHVIEGLLLPNWAGAMEQLVNPMSSSALRALQDVDQGNRPPIPIPARGQQHMNMIWHDHDGVQPNSGFQCGAGVPFSDSAFTEAMLQHQIPCSRGQSQSCSAERNEQIAVGSLQMRQPTPVSLLGQNGFGHDSWAGTRPLPSEVKKSRGEMSVPDEHEEERSCGNTAVLDGFAGGGARATRGWGTRARVVQNEPITSPARRRARRRRG
jgi:hypothetical protein